MDLTHVLKQRCLNLVHCDDLPSRIGSDIMTSFSEHWLMIIDFRPPYHHNPLDHQLQPPCGASVTVRGRDREHAPITMSLFANVLDS
ncbi:hypothetical protein CPC08DRAFT_705872 [Agrocybe pediades]|nr:hypothetical protein CPC08DRAFT_705872 [Agrocybe pediades]